MGKATLVERDIGEGKRLLERLVGSGEKAPVALWLYDSDSESWRLVLAISQVAKGAREGYYFIGAILKEMPQPFHLTLQDIKLVSPRDRLVKALLTDKRSARALTDRILPALKIGDAYLEGAYLYQVA